MENFEIEHYTIRAVFHIYLKKLQSIQNVYQNFHKTDAGIG